jgi:hypothetical protein
MYAVKEWSSVSPLPGTIHCGTLQTFYSLYIYSICYNAYSGQNGGRVFFDLKLVLILCESINQNFKSSLYFTKMSDSNGSIDEDSDNGGPKRRQVSVENQRAIFFACSSTMVNG